MLRTEEDRRSAKLDCMKKHLGATKAAAHAHSDFSMPVFDPVPLASPTSSENETVKLELKVNELMKQVEKLSQKPKDTRKNNSPVSPQPVKQKPNKIAKLENQRAELTKQVEMLVQNLRVTCKSEKTKPRDSFAANTRQPQASFKIPGMPRARFCFKCGEDNHIAARCTNEPNPTLVREKNAELRKKQADPQELKPLIPRVPKLLTLNCKTKTQCNPQTSSTLTYLFAPRTYRPTLCSLCTRRWYAM